MPKGLYRLNTEAWTIWAILSEHGRDYGRETPFLRLDSMRGECDRGSDPEGLFWRVRLLESKWQEYMRKQIAETKKK